MLQQNFRCDLAPCELGRRVLSRDFPLRSDFAQDVPQQSRILLRGDRQLR